MADINPEETESVKTEEILEEIPEEIPEVILEEALEGSAAADTEYDDLVTEEAIEGALTREKNKNNYINNFRNTIFILITVAAAAVLLAILFLPVMRISGSSMTDTLHDKDIVIAINNKNYDTGDVIAFYYNNNILVKRVIAQSGDWVDIDDDGNVSVNGQVIEEDYITEKSLGDCNINLPYQVPDEQIFVMGDHRATSIDSRNTQVGCIDEDLTIGRILVCVWPLEDAGIIH